MARRFKRGEEGANGPIRLELPTKLQVGLALVALGGRQDTVAVRLKCSYAVISRL